MSVSIEVEEEALDKIVTDVLKGWYEDAMLEFNVEDYVDSAKEAVAIGKMMGKKVILMGCSTGSSLSLYLAAEDSADQSLHLRLPLLREPQELERTPRPLHAARSR